MLLLLILHSCRVTVQKFDKALHAISDCDCTWTWKLLERITYCWLTQSVLYMPNFVMILKTHTWLLTKPCRLSSYKTAHITFQIKHSNFAIGSNNYNLNSLLTYNVQYFFLFVKISDTSTIKLSIYQCSSPQLLLLCHETPSLGNQKTYYKAQKPTVKPKNLV